MKKCDVVFVCGKQWSALEETSRSDARYCDDCGRDVFMVKTASEAAVASALKRCVGIADDNDFVGLVGEPGPAGLDWMEAVPRDVEVTLSQTLNDERLLQLRREFPAIFDGSRNERTVLAGERLRLGEFGEDRMVVLLGELAARAPELVAFTEGPRD